MLTQTEARTRAATLTVEEYDITLDLTGAASSDTFRSKTVVTFGATAGASSFIDLDAGSLETLTLNEVDLTPLVSGARIMLTGLAARNELTAIAQLPYSSSSEGVHRFTDPADGKIYTYLLAALDNARKAYACFDQPDLKARFRFTIIAPDDWIVVSNSALEARAGNVWRFAPTPPMSTYLGAFAAGPYAAFHSSTVHPELGEIPLGLYCRQSLASHMEAAEIFELTRAAFGFYTQDAFRGVEYPWGKYEQVYVPELNWGAMECPGCVIFNDDMIYQSKVTALTRQHRAEVIAHEMAHMWFGDLVTFKWWNDTWLNESFATVMALFAVDGATDYRHAWTQFHADSKVDGYLDDSLPTTHPIAARIADTLEAVGNFDGISYGKGGAVLRALAGLVGDDTFFAAARRYFPAHAYGNTELPDLLAALTKASGRELTQWSRAWLEAAGTNTLRLDGAVLRQQAPAELPTLRPHRVLIGRYDLDGDSLLLRDRISVDIDGAEAPVPELANDDSVLRVINDGDLTFATTRLDPQSLDTVVAHLSKVPDPLTRAVIWTALFETVRAAEAPASLPLQIALTHLAAETDLATAESVLTRLRVCLDRFCPPATAASYRHELAELLLTTALAAVGGEDLQLIHTRWFIRLADQTHRDLLSAWLSGTHLPPGLVVDQELGWEIVIRLAALGAIDRRTIEARRDNDGGALADRHALTALSALPNPAEKEAAFALMTAPGLTPARMRAAASGFFIAGQDDLVRPYAGRFIAALTSLWENQPVETARRFTEFGFPDTLADPETLAIVDSLDPATLPAPGRRLLAERRAELARSIRIRNL